MQSVADSRETEVFADAVAEEDIAWWEDDVQTPPILLDQAPEASVVAATTMEVLRHGDPSIAGIDGSTGGDGSVPDWWLAGCLVVLGPGLLLMLLGRRRRQRRHLATTVVVSATPGGASSTADDAVAPAPPPAMGLAAFSGPAQALTDEATGAGMQTQGWGSHALLIDWSPVGDELLMWHDWRWAESVTMEHDLSRVWRLCMAAPRLLAPVSQPVCTADGSPDTSEIAESVSSAYRDDGVHAAPEAPQAPQVASETSAWEDALAQLLRLGDDLFETTIDADSGRPVISVLAYARPSAQVLALLDAIQDTTVPAGHDDVDGDWLHVELLRMQLRHGSRGRLDAAHLRAQQTVSRWLEVGDQPERDGWRAQRIRLHLARIGRETGASRLFALRALRVTHRPDISRDGAAPLKAWLDVLWYWAALTHGDAARAVYDDAMAVCDALATRSGQQDAAQRLAGQTMVRRAAIEQGGVRIASLEQAQALHDTLYLRTGSAHDALVVAQTALERLRLGTTRNADEVCAHALSHAFFAAADPRLAQRSVECRLQAQLAYESLPGMGIQSDVALGLVHALDTATALSHASLEDRVVVLQRHGHHRRASELCALASRQGLYSPVLRSLWESSSRGWGLEVPAIERDAWQANARQLHLTSR